MFLLAIQKRHFLWISNTMKGVGTGHIQISAYWIRFDNMRIRIYSAFKTDHKKLNFYRYQRKTLNFMTPQTKMNTIFGVHLNHGRCRYPIFRGFFKRGLPSCCRVHSDECSPREGLGCTRCPNGVSRRHSPSQANAYELEATSSPRCCASVTCSPPGVTPMRNWEQVQCRQQLLTGR